MKPPAKGTLNKDGKSKSIALHLDRELFDKISALAAASNIPMGQQLRIYIGRGMNVRRVT